MKKRVLLILTVLLLMANFFIIFHSVAPKANADWTFDGAFTLAGPDPCLCPHKGYTCYCFNPPPGN